MISCEAKLVYKFDSPNKEVSFVIFESAETFEFQEGQFVMIEVEINGEIIKRPYSIATTNQCMQDNRHLWIVVKKTSDHGMSHYLTQAIQIGDTVGIKGPVGHYTDSKTHPNYLLISTWSGLSPNVGIFTHLIHESWKFEQIINLFGEKTYADIVPEIEAIFTGHNKDKVTNIFHLSREDESFFNKQNILSPDKGKGSPLGVGVWKPWITYLPWRILSSVTQAIQHLWTETSCFVCGQPDMVEEVRGILEKLGVDREDITFEKYS